jgi:hypothetical protein
VLKCGYNFFTPLHHGLKERSKNVWIDKTIPSTELQCIRYVCHKHWVHAMDKGIVKIVTLEQFAQMPQAVAA